MALEFFLPHNAFQTSATAFQMRPAWWTVGNLVWTPLRGADAYDGVWSGKMINAYTLTTVKYPETAEDIFYRHFAIRTVVAGSADSAHAVWYSADRPDFLAGAFCFVVAVETDGAGAIRKIKIFKATGFASFDQVELASHTFSPVRSDWIWVGIKCNKATSTIEVQVDVAGVGTTVMTVTDAGVTEVNGKNAIGYFDMTVKAPNGELGFADYIGTDGAGAAPYSGFLNPGDLTIMYHQPTCDVTGYDDFTAVLGPGGTSRNYRCVDDANRVVQADALDRAAMDAGDTGQQLFRMAQQGNAAATIEAVMVQSSGDSVENLIAWVKGEAISSIVHEGIPTSEWRYLAQTPGGNPWTLARFNALWAGFEKTGGGAGFIFCLAAWAIGTNLDVPTANADEDANDCQPPRGAAELVGRGVFNLTKAGRGVYELSRSSRGVFDVTRTARDSGGGAPTRAGRGIFDLTKRGRGGAF